MVYLITKKLKLLGESSTEEFIGSVTSDKAAVLLISL